MMESEDTFLVHETQSPESEELNHIDKIVGVVTEPSATFTTIAKFPAKTIDWLLPIFILLIIAAASVALSTRNPIIKAQIKEQARGNIEKALKEQVDKGSITQAEAADRLEKGEKQLEYIGTPMGTLFQSLSILLIGFIVFFVIGGYYLLASKIFLKSSINYKQVLVANGFSAYITAVGMILGTGLTFFLDRQLGDISISSLLGYKGKDFLSFVLARLDIMLIWSYFIFSIGLAKFSKAEKTTGYYIVVFASWLGWSGLFFGLSKLFPMFSRLGG